MLCRRIARCRLEEKLWLWFKGFKRLVMKLMGRDDILARYTGRRRLFEHMMDQGEQVETLWESGKTIRHLTREERQVTWNEREVNISK